MKHNLYSTVLIIIAFFGFNQICKAGDILPNDTLVFDLASAEYSTIGLDSYVEFPVYITGPNDTVNAIDFWFPFNTGKLTFVSTTSVYTTLDVYSNYIITSETLSSTSSTFSIYEYLPNLTDLIIVKFQLNNACDRIEIEDLINPTALINGVETEFIITSPQDVQLPDVQITSQSPFCPNTPISFSYSGQVNGQSISNYNWNFGNNITASSQSPSVSIPQEGVNNISLVITTDLGCVFETSSLINISPGPVSSFDADIIVNTTQVSFSSTSTISSGSITGYSWNFGDGSGVVTDQSPTHTYPSSGPYQVTLTTTSDLGCTDDITISVDVPVGLLENVALNPVRIYPNPSAGDIHLISSEEAIYQMFDESGREVASGQILQNQKHTIATSRFSRGIYMMNIVTENQKHVTKIVIQ